jgi:hypothetical protein
VKEISPELALVDPELAAEARAALPDAPVAGPTARRARRRRPRLALTVGVLAAIGLAAGFVLLMKGESGRPQASSPGGAPSSLYTWRPSAGAAYYDVALVRDGRPIRVLRTEDSWVRLPTTLTFAPGNYRLTVRPAVPGEAGVQLGTPIVERTFRVGGG